MKGIIIFVIVLLAIFIAYGIIDIFVSIIARKYLDDIRFNEKMLHIKKLRKLKIERFLRDKV